MNCKQISSLIIEQIDGTLDKLQSQAVIAHTNSCAICKSQLEHEQLLQRSFKSMASTEAPDEFYDGMFDRAFDQVAQAKKQTSTQVTSINASKQQTHFSDRIFNNAFTGFSSAIAAGLVFWLVLSPAHQAQLIDTTSQPIATATATAHSNNDTDIEIALNDVEHIRLSFEAPEHFTRVTMTLRFPEQLELKGFPGQREISWETSLNSGINVLTLPVIAKGLGHAVVEAKISNQEKSKTFKIHMNTKPGDQASLAVQV